MTTPLAIVYYENLLPGSKLVNRLQDLGYRVQPILNSSALAQEVAQQKPLVLVMELANSENDVLGVIKAIRSEPSTSHVPVLAYASASAAKLQAAARHAGATLVADEAGLVAQLPQMLEHVLSVD
jgi:CheY-like chemotaxis protein